MSDKYYYKVEIELLLTADRAGLGEQLEGEINVFCHNVEKLEGITHVYLHNHEVKCEGPEPWTAAGSLD
jgi:hypothetical protein